MTDYREYKIVSTHAGLSFHLLKLPSTSQDLVSLGPRVKLYRPTHVTQETPETPQSSVFDASKVAPTSGIAKMRAAQAAGQLFKRKTKSYFLPREEGADDIHKRRQYDPDRRPFVLANLDKSIVFEGRVEGEAQESNYVFFMFSVSLFSFVE